MTATEKVHMLRCASSLVTATYGKVRLVPRASRALPLEFFTKPTKNDFLDLGMDRKL